MSSPWQALLHGVGCAAGIHAGDWETAPGSECVEARTCSHCGRIEQREKHQWGLWSYDESVACAVRSCSLCGRRESPFPELVLPAEQAPSETADPLVAALITDNVAAMRAYLAASPATAQREEALGFLEHPGHLIHLSALNLYCLSIAETAHAEHALKLATALQTASRATYESGHADFLQVAGWSAFQIVRALRTLGRDEDLVRRTSEMLDWLLARGATINICELQLALAEAHLALRDFPAAESRLCLAEAIALTPEEMGSASRRASVRESYNKLAATDARELGAPAPPSDAVSVEDQIDWLLKNLHTLPPEQAKSFETLLTRVRAEGGTGPESWMGSPESATEQLATLLGAGSSGTRVNVQQRIRAAAGLAMKEVEGRDPVVLAKLVDELRDIAQSAASNGWSDEQATTQWLLQTCYRRLERFAEALALLHEIRDGLEQRRATIADRMKRAGIFSQFPKLFPVLAEVNFQLGEPVGVLDAIETGKARMLRDLLETNETGGTSGVVASADSVAPALTEALAGVRAHYLSFLVDDDCVWAALLTNDGTALAERVELDRATIRRYAAAVDPSKWGKRSGGVMGRKIPDDLPDRLAPLVAWLGELWDEGLLQEGDHLCYSPDDELHLVPLHLLKFRGKPLLESLSVSRIHSARALIGVLAQPPLRATRFVAVQSPAQEDAEEVALGFSAASGWLLQSLPGSVVAGEDATLPRIRTLDCRGRLVHFTTHGMFPAAGNTLLDPNPFRSSGVLLAAPAGLPSKNAAARGEAADCLLTPAAILELDFTGAHVTLQACSSGLSREGAGGDALGMEYAFLLAGAPSVLAAHWDVPLGASSEYCIMFYRSWLKQGMSRARAWRATTRELLAATGSPHVWAAFSLTGDWR